MSSDRAVENKWITVEPRKKWRYTDNDSGISAILSIRDNREADFWGKKPGYVLRFCNALNTPISVKDNHESVYLGNNKKTERKPPVSLSQAQDQSLVILNDLLKIIVMPVHSENKIMQWRAESKNISRYPNGSLNLWMQDIMDSGFICVDTSTGFENERSGASSDRCLDYFNELILGALQQSMLTIQQAQEDVVSKKQALDAILHREEQRVPDFSESASLYTRTQVDEKLVSKRIGSWRWGITVYHNEPVYEYARTGSYSAPPMSKNLTDAIWAHEGACDSLKALFRNICEDVRSSAFDLVVYENLHNKVYNAKGNADQQALQKEESEPEKTDNILKRM